MKSRLALTGVMEAFALTALKELMELKPPENTFVDAKMALLEKDSVYKLLRNL